MSLLGAQKARVSGLDNMAGGVWGRKRKFCPVPASRTAIFSTGPVAQDNLKQKPSESSTVVKP